MHATNDLKIFIYNILIILIYYNIVNILHREKYHSTAKKSDYSVYFSFFK